jgi:hypothetical protein
MELRNRARFYAKVVNHLYAKRGIRGKLVTATRGARHLSLGIRLPDPLNLDVALRLANPLALATSVPNVLSQRLPTSPGLVSYQFELKPGYWQTVTRADVTGLGVGLGEQRRQVDFTFDDAPHCLVAGSTGCGKSISVASILIGLCEVYPPDQLKMIVVDPDHDLEAFDNVVHLALPVAREYEEISKALSWAGRELATRKEHNVRDAYRLLMVVDEAEDTLNEEERLAIAQAIARGGRKFNINLLVATQKPKQSKLPDLINQLGNRFVGKCDNAQTSVLLTGHAGLQAHKLTSGGGDFLHVNGEIERLQVALPTARDYDFLPRGEIDWPTIDREDIPRILNFPITREGGRPPVEIKPRKVAHYVYYGPEAISISQAEEWLGLKRRGHERHKEFATEFLDEIDRLKERDDE